MGEITDLHVPFAKWLTTLPVVVRRSRSDRETSETPGEPDFTIFRGNAFALFIEFKTKEGKLSKNQKKRHAEYQSAGATIHVTNDITFAQNLVTQWLETLKRWGVDQPKEQKRIPKLMIGSTEWEEYAPGKLRRVDGNDAEIQDLVRKPSI